MTETYDLLSDKFKAVYDGFQARGQFEEADTLDDIITKLADEIDTVVRKARDFTQMACAKAVCSLCNEGLARVSINGREYHRDGETVARCSANAIFNGV